MNQANTLNHSSGKPKWHLKSAALSWMYLLVCVPALTDLIENGHLPPTPRGWITEIVVGLLIGLLVNKVRKEHFSVMELTRIDALTGLWNRRAFDEVVTDECVRKKRSGRTLSLVYLDLDNFKIINDQHGHNTGDRVLQQLASAFGVVIRDRFDRGFRLGGDEFAILLPNSDATQASALVSRIKEHCLGLDPLWRAGSLGISAGIVEFRAPESASDFIKRADAAMYNVKQVNRRQTPGN